MVPPRIFSENRDLRPMLLFDPRAGKKQHQRGAGWLRGPRERDASRGAARAAALPGAPCTHSPRSATDNIREAQGGCVVTSDDVFPRNTCRYRDVIPRRARPGLSGLRPHMRGNKERDASCLLADQKGVEHATLCPGRMCGEGPFFQKRLSLWGAGAGIKNEKEMIILGIEKATKRRGGGQGMRYESWAIEIAPLGDRIRARVSYQFTTGVPRS